MKKYTPDRDLTENAFLAKYTTGESKIGELEDLEKYLRLRHQALNNKITFAQSYEAYMKTSLYKKHKR